MRALHQPWQPVFVDFMHGATRNGAWREAANQIGEVPMPEDGALRLMQSGLILTHLVRAHSALGGNGQADRREMLRWIPFDNHKFTSYLANHRFMKAFAASAPDPAVMAWLRDRLDNALGIADKALQCEPRT